MEIHLARDGAALGVFSAQEVREGLAAGRYRPSDLAWRAGMAAWAPLAEWPEFAGAGAPPFLADASAPASQIPWEQAAGVGSLLRTLWLVVSAPGKLASGRFPLGGSLGLSYAAVGLGFLPIVGLAVLSAASQEARGEALLGLLEGPLFEGARESVRESFAGDGVAFGIPVAACSALVLPLVNLLLGLLSWVGLRFTGAKVPFVRVVAVGMTLHTLVAVALLPLSYLAALAALALPLLGLACEVALVPVSLVFLALGIGRALALNPWRVVLAWLVLLLLLTCCICGCAGVGGLISAAAGGG